MEKKNQNDNSFWNLNEFMHAALIMLHFHKLAVIVEAIDIRLKSNCGNTVNCKYSNSELNNTEVKLNILKNLEVIVKEDDNINKNEKFCTTPQEDKTDLDLADTQEKICEEMTKTFDKFLNKYCTVYHDFDPHSEEYRSYLEFNWFDHGYYILKNVYPEGIDSLNNEIDWITSLTTNSLGEEDSQLNTLPIRYAISCYIEKILGYYHEDYNYSNVNRLLPVNYKKFIKNVACYPHRLEIKDFIMMNLAFNNEEIMHIILLVAIIKLRTQLTYLSSSLYEIIKNID